MAFKLKVLKEKKICGGRIDFLTNAFDQLQLIGYIIDSPDKYVTES